MSLPFITTSPLGMIFDEPDIDYRRSRCLGSTALKDYLQSPDGFRYRYIEKLPEYQFRGSKSTEDGVAVHLKCQGEEHYQKAVIIIPDEYMTKGGKVSTSKAAEAWQDAQTARCITRNDDAKYCFLYERIMANPVAARLLHGTQKEVTGRIIDRVTGLPVQVRWDIFHDEWSCDVKTTGDSINKFKWSVRDFRYDVQAALYTSVRAALKGKVVPFFWIVISTCYPFECRVIEASEHMLQGALSDVDRALKGIATKDWGTPQTEPEVMEAVSV